MFQYQESFVRTRNLASLCGGRWHALAWRWERIQFIILKVQNTEQISSHSKAPPFGLRREGGRDVPICQYKIMRISAKPLFGSKITSAIPAGRIKSLSVLRARRARRVTQHNPSLHSGRIDYVQNGEDICLRQIRFTILKHRSKSFAFALVRGTVQIRWFSARKWRRKPTNRICSLPKASGRAPLKKLFGKSFFRIFKKLLAF